jgi:hypothetical protein
MQGSPVLLIITVLGGSELLQDSTRFSTCISLWSNSEVALMSDAEFYSNYVTQNVGSCLTMSVPTPFSIISNYSNLNHASICKIELINT